MKKFIVAVVLVLSVPNIASAQSAESQFFKGIVTVPHNVTVEIAEHLRKIAGNGWAEVVPGDLYHGHILLSADSDKQERFSSLEELFSSGVMMLYHADEQLRRWRLDDGDLPVSKRRPRSIVAFRDGRVIPAATLLADPINSATHYEWAGTIHPDDIAVEVPSIAKLRFRKVLTPRGWCHITLQFDFYSPDIFTTDPKVTMDCIDPSARLIK